MKGVEPCGPSQAIKEKAITAARQGSNALPFFE